MPSRVGGEDEGQVVLSLHHQAGMRVRPARVRIERAIDPQDAIPFVRLVDDRAGRSGSSSPGGAVTSRTK
ncbi:MAG: hypothetical protein U0797_08495 [Gemmataceae bacterium]